MVNIAVVAAIAVVSGVMRLAPGNEWQTLVLVVG